MKGSVKTVDKLHKFRKYALILAIAFLAIFLLRWGYEVYFSRNDVYVSYGNTDYPEISTYEMERTDGSRSYSNVASAKVQQTDVSGTAVTIDQKYEKTANISANTEKFDEEKQKIGNLIEDNNAVIQAENTTGLPGAQSLYLEIGVSPDNFDTLVEQLKNVDFLDSFRVQKVDRTSQYKMLMAEKETLETTRDSYIAIKKQAKTISEMLSLEEKILEVEGQLQNMGVDLGVFSTENSFCTIKFSLKETASRTISVRYILSCSKNALGWTFLLYVVVGFAILFLLGVLALILSLFTYLKTSVSKKDSDLELGIPSTSSPSDLSQQPFSSQIELEQKDKTEKF